jgi:hypothetical protein
MERSPTQIGIRMMKSVCLRRVDTELCCRHAAQRRKKLYLLVGKSTRVLRYATVFIHPNGTNAATKVEQTFLLAYFSTGLRNKE